MAGSNPNLRLWSDFAEDDSAPAHRPADLAQRLYASETLLPDAKAPLDGPEPFSLQWFLNIESIRHGRHGKWLPKLFEFTKHAGDTLLGLGYGLGTDWLQFARHGAHVVVSSPSTAQLTLMRRNFELRGLPARFLPALTARLPLEANCIDVACISGLLSTVNDPAALLAEVFRVLKPGGKVVALTHAKRDVHWWARTCFFLQTWFDPGYRKASEGEGNRFSPRQLHRLFGRFVEHRVYKRHLRRSEVPHVWRWLPRPFLERVMGHYHVIKAFKPLSSVIPLNAAA